MINRKFIEKAQALKPVLFIEEKILKGEERLLKADDEAVFDFGNHYAGYLEISLESEGHHQDAPLFFSVQFAEIKEELDQDTDAYSGWISRSWVQKEEIHIDVLPAVYKLERRYAFRYVKIRIISTSDNFKVRITQLKLRAVSSADERKLEHVEMKEADQILDRVACRTLHDCMQEVFEDGPKRDRRLWLGDLRLEAIVNYQTYRNYDLVKRCLYLFAGTTLEEGRPANNIFIEPEPECDYQTMFDYTLFFIDTLWDYYEASRDLETLEELEPVCMKQFGLLRECFDENDLPDMEKAGNVFIDWNMKLDKQASAQAVWVYSLKDLVKIEQVLGKDPSLIEEEIRKKSEAAWQLFDQEKGLFVSGRDKQISWASQILMILAKIPSEEESLRILHQIRKTEDAEGMSSPYMYHHYIQALIDLGRKDEAYQAMHEYWGGMIARGTDTFWEIYNPKDPDESPYGGIVIHSFCHAWSCTPAYFLRKYYY